jgi:biotin carboxyl carrier protein
MYFSKEQFKKMFKAIVNDTSEFSIERNGDTFLINGKETTLDISKISEKRFHVIRDFKSYTIEIIEVDTANKKFRMQVNGTLHTIQLKDKLDQMLHSLGMDKAMTHKANDIKAPMPGLVLKVLATEGQKIKAGEPVIILEAMKMENIIKSPSEGAIEKVFVKNGDKVEKNQVLVKIG